eukprot:jgi/Chrzof1/3381/Cz12g23100.t1
MQAGADYKHTYQLLHQSIRQAAEVAAHAATQSGYEGWATATAHDRLVRMMWSKLQRLRRRRMSVCLVAEHKSTKELAGYASVRMIKAQALLPPPFPSRMPYRLYTDGLAVARHHQGRGVGRRLLQACERVGAYAD